MDNLSKVRRSWNMGQISSRNTKPELRVRSIIHNLGIRFRLHCKSLAGTPDLVFRSRRTVLFVHGCFWHRHENCKNSRMPASRREFWETKLNGNVKRDQNNLLTLTELGWNVIVVWECELKCEAALTRRLKCELRGSCG